MAKDLLFEIGAEEIPAGFMPNILGQLKTLAETKLMMPIFLLKASQHTAHHVVWLLL